MAFTADLRPGALRKRKIVLDALWRNPKANDYWRDISVEEYARFCRGETKSFGEHLDRTDARTAYRYFDTLPPRLQAYTREVFPEPPEPWVQGQRPAFRP